MSPDGEVTKECTILGMLTEESQDGTSKFWFLTDGDKIVYPYHGKNGGRVGRILKKDDHGALLWESTIRYIVWEKNDDAFTPLSLVIPYHVVRQRRVLITSPEVNVLLLKHGNNYWLIQERRIDERGVLPTFTPPLQLAKIPKMSSARTLKKVLEDRGVI